MKGLARYLSKNAGTTPNNTSNILPQAPVTPLRSQVESPGPFGYKPQQTQAPYVVQDGAGRTKGAPRGLPDGLGTAPMGPELTEKNYPGDTAPPPVPTDIDGVPPTGGQLDTAQENTTPWYDSPGVKRDENDQPIWPGPGPMPDPGTEEFYQQFPGQEEVAQQTVVPEGAKQEPLVPPGVAPPTTPADPPAPADPRDLQEPQVAQVAQPNEFYDATMAKNFASNLKSFAPGQVNKTYEWMRNSGDPELVAQAGQGHIPFRALNANAQRAYGNEWQNTPVVQSIEDKQLASGQQKVRGKSPMPDQLKHLWPKRYPQAAPRPPNWR